MGVFGGVERSLFCPPHSLIQFHAVGTVATPVCHKDSYGLGRLGALSKVSLGNEEGRMRAEASY